MELNEDYTAGVLKGIPIFLINRVYESNSKPGSIILARYAVTLPNFIKISVVQFADKIFSAGHDFEMMIVETNGIFIDPKEYYYTDDVYRGSAREIHDIMCRLEKLK